MLKLRGGKIRRKNTTAMPHNRAKKNAAMVKKASGFKFVRGRLVAT